MTPGADTLAADEPYAAQPRLPKWPAHLDPWDYGVNPDDGYAVVDSASIEGHHLDLAEVSDWEFNSCAMANVVLVAAPKTAVALVDSHLRNCDLSRVRLTSLRRCRLEGCKLSGTDVSGIAIQDVVLERSTLSYTNFRMSTLERVAFDECTLHDTDFFEADLSDVDFAWSSLSEVSTDRTSFKRVDLREVAELDLTGALDLSGCLASEAQVYMLAHTLAQRSGLTIYSPALEDSP